MKETAIRLWFLIYLVMIPVLIPINLFYRLFMGEGQPKFEFTKDVTGKYPEKKS